MGHPARSEILRLRESGGTVASLSVDIGERLTSLTSQYFAGMGYIGQAVNFSWANEVCRDDDQLRSLTLYSMVYGSNVTIAWFNIVSGE
jgi:hypothetical protein